MSKMTDRQARAIKPGDKTKPTGITGLTLKPTKTKGHGKWNLRFVSPVTGKRRDMGLGTYPDISVADALKRGRQAREDIAAGLDPLIKRHQQNNIHTFEQAARDRHQQLLPGFRNARHIQNWIRSLEMYVFPHIGNLRVDILTPQHFADMLRPIWLEKADTASRIKQRCHTIMAMCYARGITHGNPLDVAHLLLPTQNRIAQHFPAMPWQHLPTFVKQHLTSQPIHRARIALTFLILTAARSGEVRGATWDEIDLQNKLWTIPAERMKARRKHRIPLPGQAITLLHQHHPGNITPDTLIFPSARGKILPDTAFTNLLHKAKAPSDTPGHVATTHGFRASFRNWATDHDYPHDIAERALAHSIANKVHAAYERTDRLAARVTMMEHWADHVTGAKPVSAVGLAVNP